MAFDTVANIVSDAAEELGLVSAPIADPFASTDPNIVRLLVLLKRLGRKLVEKRRWTWLQQQYTFTTVQGQGQYPMPPDFGRVVDQTGWNRTNRLPLGGPLTAQQWQFLKARLVGVVFTVLERFVQGNLWLYPDTNTPGNYTLAYEYISKNWVQAAGTPAWAAATNYAFGAFASNGGNNYLAVVGGQSDGTGPTGLGVGIVDGGVTWNYVVGTADAPANKADVLCFDAPLLVTGLVLEFKKASGFDTTSAQDDFDEQWGLSVDADSHASVLELGKPNGFGEPLLGPNNIPITGLGN